MPAGRIDKFARDGLDCRPAPEPEAVPALTDRDIWGGGVRLAVIPSATGMKGLVVIATEFVRLVKLFIPIIGGTGTEPELPESMKPLGVAALIDYARALCSSLEPDDRGEPRRVRVRVDARIRPLVGGRLDGSEFADIYVYGPDHFPGLSALGFQHGYRGWDPTILMGVEWLSLTFYGLLRRWRWIVPTPAYLVADGRDRWPCLMLPESRGESITAKELATLDRALSLLPPTGTINRRARDEYCHGWLDMSSRFAAGPDPDYPVPEPGDGPGDASPDGNPRPPGRRTAREKENARAAALALRIKHPEWDDKTIAKAVGCHPKSMRRWKEFRAASDLVKAEAEARRDEIPRGRRDTESGTIEAWATPRHSP